MELLLIFVKLIDKKDLVANAEAFQLIDKDRTGSINASECLTKVRSINREASFGIKIDEENMHRFIEKVDINKTGRISYSQFLCATLTEEHYSETNLKNLFTDLDHKN